MRASRSAGWSPILLAVSLAPARYGEAAEPPPFRFIARAMRARIDLRDKDAVRDALDEVG